MTKAPVTLQDLRRKVYVKAKADASWRFWGLYVHVCKPANGCGSFAFTKFGLKTRDRMRA
jgi:RNA-directed DNA polymerase